jgi:hypothetical protein
MTYYYKMRPGGELGSLDDDWVNSRNRPRIVFEEDNRIKIWWHKNDATGKIDMNINMADLHLRKLMAT